jgi:flavin-dependent thymidylate synthase
MSERKVTILTGDPTIEVIAHMKLTTTGLERMARWVKEHRPECLPDDYNNWTDLFPHKEMSDDYSPRSDNELLVELAGRKCYDSFGLKAGKRTNKEYIANTQGGDIPHSSIMYHAKMSFFFAGISRRVSHEIIRNYVGADRDEEGSPSQESTRFTHHYGFFIMPPRYLTDVPGSPAELQSKFTNAMQASYDAYLDIVENEVTNYQGGYGRIPTGIEKKRIYEAASSFLPHQSETSFIWTTNPMAIAKFCRERDNEAADLEIQRFARKWKKLCVKCWPNLFPHPWMHE